MERTNDLIPKIIELHKKREGLKDGGMTQREANLIVCCLEQFDMFLECRQNFDTGERQLTIPDVSGMLLLQVKELFVKLTDDERMEVMSDYCKHCGCNDSGCQCWNDD